MASRPGFCLAACTATALVAVAQGVAAPPAPCVATGVLATLAPGQAVPAIVGPTLAAADRESTTTDGAGDQATGLKLGHVELGVAGCVGSAGSPGGTAAQAAPWSVLGGALRGDSLDVDLVPVAGDGSGWHLRARHDGLELDGKPAAVPVGQEVPVGDWGVLQAQVSVDAGPGEPLRWWRAALALRLVRAHGGLAAGTTLLIGWASAGKRPGAPPQPAVAPPVPPKPKPEPKPKRPAGRVDHDAVDDNGDDDDRDDEQADTCSAEAEAKAEAEAEAAGLPPDRSTAARHAAARARDVRLPGQRARRLGRHVRWGAQRRAGRLAPRRRSVRRSRDARRRRRRRDRLRRRLEPRRRLASLAARRPAATRSTTRTSPATPRLRATTIASTAARCWDSSATRATPSRPSLTSISRCTRTACCTSATTGLSIRRRTWRAGSGSTACRRRRRSSLPSSAGRGQGAVSDFRRLLALRPLERPARPADREPHPAAQAGGGARPTRLRAMVLTSDGWGAVAAALVLLGAASVAVGVAGRNGRSS